MFSIYLSPLFSLTPRAQRKKLAKKKRRQGTRSGLCPKNPLKNFLKKVFKIFKNFLAGSAQTFL